MSLSGDIALTSFYGYYMIDPPKNSAKLVLITNNSDLEFKDIEIKGN